MYKLSVAVLLLCVGLISAGDLLHGHQSFAAAPALGLGGYSAHYAAAPAAVYQSGYGAGLGLAHGGASYVAAAPAYGYAHAAPALGYAHATAKHVQYGQPSVQNVFAEREHVIPGQEYVYKVQAPPKIKKEVVQVAQVVHQPKVLYSEVVAPAKVNHETVVVDQKPQIVSVQPHLHKEQVVFVQPKAEEKYFVAQKRRDTVAKRVEYERHNFKTVHINPHPEVKVVGVNQYEKAPSVSVHGPGPVAPVAVGAHAAALYPSSGFSAVNVAHAPAISHAHYGHHYPAAASFAHYPAGAGFLPSAGALLPSTGALFPSTASLLPSTGATITKVEHKPAVTVVNEGSALPALASSSSLLSGTKI